MRWQGLRGILAMWVVTSPRQSRFGLVYQCWLHVFAMAFGVGGCGMVHRQRLWTCLLPCSCHAFAISMRSIPHVGSMRLPCPREALSMLSQQCFNAFSSRWPSRRSAYCHALAKSLPCRCLVMFCHAFALVPSRTNPPGIPRVHRSRCCPFSVA